MAYEVPITRREAVARQLRTEILSGELPPGAPIKDAELAARLGVSITPVREAITQLISEGLIKTDGSRRRQVSELTQRDAVELMDMLGVILVAALERAAPRNTPTFVAALQEAVEELLAAIAAEDLPRAGLAIRSISNVILQAADHNELRTTAESVLRRTFPRIRVYPSRHLEPLWIEAFPRVVENLKAGDSDAAVHVLAAFFRELVDRMQADRVRESVLDPRTRHSTLSERSA